VIQQTAESDNVNGLIRRSTQKLRFDSRPSNVGGMPGSSSEHIHLHGEEVEIKGAKRIEVKECVLIPLTLNNFAPEFLY